MSDPKNKRVYLPDGFDTVPTTPVEALKAARGVLEEEGRWCQGAWYQNEHPDLDPSDPFCNSWSACAQGAVAVVVYGATCYQGGGSGDGTWNILEGAVLGGSESCWSYLRTPDEEALYELANDFLEEAGRLIWPESEGTTVPGYNDDWCKSRKDVLAWFDKAIQLAEADASETGDTDE